MFRFRSLKERTLAICGVENSITSVFSGLSARFYCDGQVVKSVRLADTDDTQSERSFT